MKFRSYEFDLRHPDVL